MGHDIFISYDFKDKNFAEKVCHILEKNNIRCWVAPRNIPGGMFWAEAIIDAISSAKAIVFIFSNHSNESECVARELERAFSRKHRIIPVRFHNIEPSNKIAFFVGGSHYLNAFELSEEELPKKLEESVKSILEANNEFSPQNASEIAPEEGFGISQNSPKATRKEADELFFWRQSPSGSEPLRIGILNKNDEVYTFSILNRDSRTISFKEAVQLSDRGKDIVLGAMNEFTELTGTEWVGACSKLGNVIFRSVIPSHIQGLLERQTGSIILETDDISLPWEFIHDHLGFVGYRSVISRFQESYRWAETLLGKNDFPAMPANKILIIGDPSGTMPRAAEDAADVARLFEDAGIPCDCLIGSKDCSYLEVKEYLSNNPYAIIYYSGRLVYLPDRQTSALELANQQLLLSEEICPVIQGSPLFFLQAVHAFPDNDQRRLAWQNCARNTRNITQALIQGGKSGRSLTVVSTLWGADEDFFSSGFPVYFFQRLLDSSNIGQAFKESRISISSNHADLSIGVRYGLFGNADLQLCKDKKQEAGFSAKEVDSYASEGSNLQDDKTNFSQSASSVWSDEISIVLLGAIGAKQAMNWPILSTVHLLLGLTYLPTGILSRFFSQKGLDPNNTRRVLRKALSNKTKDVPESHIKMGKNFLKIFHDAKVCAISSKNQIVEEKHLLHALLRNPQSGACTILSHLKIDLKKLSDAVANMLDVSSVGVNSSPPGVKPKLRKNPSKLFDENGYLRIDFFDKSSQNALKFASTIAQKMNWDDIRSLHVFMGILNNNQSSIGAKVLMLPGCANLVSEIYNSFRKPKKKYDHNLELKEKMLSKNTIQLLERASLSRHSNIKVLVTEKDLFDATLSDPKGIVSLILQKKEVDPSSLFDRMVH